jgi:hypothetical protein
MTKIAGSGSESINQRHGSADPDPDPHQNVMDPEHCFKMILIGPDGPLGQLIAPPPLPRACYFLRVRYLYSLLVLSSLETVS